MERRHGASSANRMVAIAIALVSVVFVLIVANTFANSTHTKVSTANAPPLAAQSLASLPNADQDTDGDGLADWEELLWDTDPTKADTDGDGVSDLTERDNEQRVYAANTDLTDEVRTTDIPLTATEAAARELFGTYMQAFADGNKLDAAERDFIVQEAKREALKYVQQSTYAEGDVNVVPRTLVAQLQYTTTIRGILEHIADQAPPEYASLLELTQGDRAQGLLDLAEAASVYHLHIADLKEVPVTDDAVRMHVNLVRALEGYALMLHNISRMEIDPLLGSTGLTQLPSAQMHMAQAFEVLILYITAVEQYVYHPELIKHETEDATTPEETVVETS